MARTLIAAAIVALSSLVAHAQLPSAADVSQRLIQSRATEAVIWGMPAVNTLLMYDQMVKAGGKAGEIIYWGRPLDWHNQTLTPNPDTLYFMGVDRASRASNAADLEKNADGSVDIWFGPKAPQGSESNWVPTDPQRKFELMFRLYAPTKALFEKKDWRLPDVDKAAAQ
jgi:hypothetical protein